MNVLLRRLMGLRRALPSPLSILSRRSYASVPPKMSNSETVVEKPREFYGTIRNVKTSPMKMNLVAKLIRKRSIGDALAQVKFCEKKVAEYIEMVLLDTHRKAVKKEVAPLNLWIAESYVGKGQYQKKVSYHGRGRSGIMTNYHAHYFLILREGKPPKKGKKLEDTWKYATRRAIQAGPKSIPNAL